MINEDINFRVSEIERRIGNIIRSGIIVAVDPILKRVKIKSQGNTPSWLPMPAEIGSNFVAWRPLRVGQQVIIASEAGDLVDCQIVGFLYSNNINYSGSNDKIDEIIFDDGTKILYDSQKKELCLDIKGSLSIKSESINIDSNINLKGDLIQTEGDIVSEKISLRKHKHKETKSITSIPLT